MIDSFFKNISLLEYNCFTILCQFLLHNKVNQLYVYTYPHIPSLFHLPPTLPISPLQLVRKHRADLPCYAAASRQLSNLHLVLYICQCYSLTSSQLTLPTPRILKSILYVCIFILSWPQVPQNLFLFVCLFFQIPYICVSIQYLFALSDLLHSV